VGPAGPQGPQGEPGLSADYQHAADDTESGTVLLSYVEKLKMTTADLPAGDYRIGYSLELGSDNKQRSEFRVQLDDATTLAEAGTAVAKNDNEYMAYSGFVVVTLTAGVHEIDVDFRALNDTALIRRVRVEIYSVP
jgi:hypothetical protein